MSRKLAHNEDIAEKRGTALLKRFGRLIEDHLLEEHFHHQQRFLEIYTQRFRKLGNYSHPNVIGIAHQDFQRCSDRAALV